MSNFWTIAVAILTVVDNSIFSATSRYLLTDTLFVDTTIENYEEHSALKAAVLAWVLPSFVPGTKPATIILADFATSRKSRKHGPLK